MILIIGTTEDDILYFKNRMKINEKNKIAMKHPYYVGSFAGKNVCLVHTGYSNVASAIITSFMITKYKPYIVISVGSVSSISPNLKQGDLFIAERLHLGDIDLTPLGKVKYGQIIDLPIFYSSEDDYIRLIQTLNSRTENLNIGRGPLVSTNTFHTNVKLANELIKQNFAHVENKIALDTESGGVVTACFIHDVPWLLLKVVTYEVGQAKQLISSARIGVEAQPHIGSLIETLLEELVHSFD